MKKTILIISIFSVCLIVPSVLLIAKNTAGFSFVIDLSRQFLGAGRTLQIVGKKKSRDFIFDEYDVKGSGLWWSEILKTSIRKELRTTDKKIILPYKEVF